jgi:hypothetical protein
VASKSVEVVSFLLLKKEPTVVYYYQCLKWNFDVVVISGVFNEPKKLEDGKD